MNQIIVVGAGIGGLAAAMCLSARGLPVTVLEQHAHVGGKMRTIDSPAGPIDAGPTVLTMRQVFDELFESCGSRLEDYVALTPARVLARHWWSNGTTLDLTNDAIENRANIKAVFGRTEAQAFEKFCARSKRLFQAFDAPMMQEPMPNRVALTKRVLTMPRLVADMNPLRNLAASLARQFKAPQLQQLFGRYATYVGGSPYDAPSLLSLIWHAEASGVWTIKGGMGQLAEAMADKIRELGGKIELNQSVARFEIQGGKIAAVITGDGTRHPCSQVVFNGDPRALHEGILGNCGRNAVSNQHVHPRSLSAYVWAFASKPEGQDLSHHNVFFADDPKVEFGDLKRGDMPRDATIYVCAQDRGGEANPKDLERFEIIMNGTATNRKSPLQEEKATCKARTFERLETMGLTFTPRPDETALTTPAEWNALFPASMGSLYGPSPHGLTAGLKRPTARTPIPGLFLAGGGVHPGAGIPMAALSGKHAAGAILSDQISTSRSRQTVTPGGMSTGSATMAPAPSRSSVS